MFVKNGQRIVMIKKVLILWRWNDRWYDLQKVFGFCNVCRRSFAMDLYMCLYNMLLGNAKGNITIRETALLRSDQSSATAVPSTTRPHTRKNRFSYLTSKFWNQVVGKLKQIGFHTLIVDNGHSKYPREDERSRVIFNLPNWSPDELGLGSNRISCVTTFRIGMQLKW